MLCVSQRNDSWLVGMHITVRVASTRRPKIVLLFKVYDIKALPFCPLKTFSVVCITYSHRQQPIETHYNVSFVVVLTILIDHRFNVIFFREHMVSTTAEYLIGMWWLAID